MKQIRTLSRVNLTLLALVTALAGTLLFAGCATTDNGDTSTPDSSGHQHSHH